MVATLRSLGADPDKIVEGVFPMEYEPAPDARTTEEDPYIVYYGSSLPVKGVPVLLDALRHLAQPVRLRLYMLHPSPSLLAQIKQIRADAASSIEVDEESRWTTGVRDAVARARAVVVPSAWHGPHELVAYESMSLGRAIIASSGSGNADLLTHGEDGLVFPMNDSRALAQAIDLVWQDPGLADRLGSNARTTYEQRLNPDRWYEAFMRAIALAQAA
jgi:glycosyltransferase involved in cell wall biosynthesis